LTKNRLFPAKGYVNFIHDALAKCIKAGYVPSPSWESVEERILNPESNHWQWHQTRGLLGVIKIDNEDCLFLTNLYPLRLNSDPDYIEKMFDDGKLVMASCPIPDSDRTEIINASGRRDNNGNLICSITPLSRGKEEHSELEHPLCEPAFGTQDRAIRYIDALKGKGSKLDYRFIDLVGYARPVGFGNDEGCVFGHAYNDLGRFSGALK